MSIWKIVDEDATEYDFSSLPISSAVIQYRNMASDSLTLTFDSAHDYGLIACLAEAEVIKIKRDGVVCFVGTVQPHYRARVVQQQVVVEVLGIWDVLEKTVFTQTFTDAVSGNTNTTSEYTFLKTTSARDRVRDAFNCAMAGGAFTRQSVEDLPHIYPPDESGINRTCANIITEYLKYFPGVFVSVDYTQTPPKFYILSPDNEAVTTLDTSAGDLTYERGTEQKVSRVCLNYERPHEVYNADGTLYSSGKVRMATDNYPAAGGYGAGVLIRTTRLSGTMKIKRLRFTMGVLGDTATLQWVYDGYSNSGETAFPYAGWLWAISGIPPTTPGASYMIGTQQFSNLPIYDVNYPYCGGITSTGLVGYPGGTSLTWYPIDTRGGAPDNGLSGNGVVLFQVVSTTLTWHNIPAGRSGTQTTIIQPPFNHYLAYRVASPHNPNDITITADVDISGSLGLRPASGAAQALYTSLNSVYRKGSLTVTESTCRAIEHLRRKVDISSTIGTVQDITQDIMTGQTRYTFGRPSHLSPQDFLALLQK